MDEGVDARDLRRQSMALLRGYPLPFAQRGRMYEQTRRVRDFALTDDTVTATVMGAQPYRVTLSLYDGELATSCTCPAFADGNACKHVAAVAWTLQRGAPLAVEGVAPLRPPRADGFPDALRHAHIATIARFALYANEPLALPSSWLPISQLWGVARRNPAGPEAYVQKVVLAHMPEVEATLRALKAWTPPAPAEGDGDNDYARLRRRLAKRYSGLRAHAQIGEAIPGPLDDRHPGFSFAYDAKRGRLAARERPSALLRSPLQLELDVAADGDDEEVIRFATLDAWHLFALRATILALDECTDETLQVLRADLSRPGWERALDQLSAQTRKKAKDDESIEIAFSVCASYRQLALQVFSRVVRAGKKDAAWKGTRLDVALERGSQLEREIARICVGAEQGRSVNVPFGTAAAHELLAALAKHPRVWVVEWIDAKAHPDAPRARIEVGALTMRFERGPTGSVVPRFVVGDVDFPLSDLAESDRSPYCSFARGARIVSARIPAELRPWIEAASRGHAELSFPPEAMNKVIETTAPLVSSGIAELPREALGAELPCEPCAGLRIEWSDEGSPVVDLLIRPHPEAPLIRAGTGPTLMSFQSKGRRVFVERDFAAEARVVEETRNELEAVLHWDGPIGSTDSVDEALAFAAWLDRNPLGLAIEVKHGRAPVTMAWSTFRSQLGADQDGAWLVLDGGLEAEGIKISFGEILEAARLARSFVRIDGGRFLQLTKEMLDKLRPVAIATDLSGAPDRIHEAFGATLAAAAELFQSVRAPDLRAYVDKLQGASTKVRVPAIANGKLRDYQRDGVAWMLRLAEWAPGCVLADDMGLGKTVQTAAVLLARAKLGPALVVAPASVSSNWVSELAKFAPKLRVRWLNEDRDFDASALGASDVVVVSYGLVHRLASLLGEVRWATTVVDEAQYLKNLVAQRRSAVAKLSRAFTVALTGTPLENNLGELFSIVDLVFPGLLGTEPIFRERFRRPIEGRLDDDRLASLAKLLAPFVLRRTRKAVLDELPPRQEITERLELSPEEKRRYLALRRACELEFGELKRDKKENPAHFEIELLAALTRLRQMACDVSLVQPDFAETPTKITRVVEVAREIAAEGHALLVFSQFTRFLEKVRDAIEGAGLRVGYLAGDTPTTRRREIIDVFQRGELDVFCVSLLAGGTGLNLTRASYVVHLDPWWNPAAEEQATSRAHRMGQTQPVTVLRLVARGTIEERVLDLHARKRKLAEAVLEGKSVARSIGANELLALLKE